jgi:hypothetical protein
MPASLNTATSFPTLRDPRRYFDLITKEKTTYTNVSARPAFFVTTNTAERHVRRVHDIQQDHLSETTMNKHVPYVWRKNYCNDERRSQNFLKIAHEKARQYLSRVAKSSVRPLPK